MRRAAAVALLMLVGCSGPATEPQPRVSGGSELEAAAIATGVISDPNSTNPVGLFARGSDQLCVLAAPADFVIGLEMDLGEGQHCSASGIARQDGETLHVTLAGKQACTFEARYEGDRIVLPGALPDGCRSYCVGRATFGGMDVERLSGSAAEARAMRDAGGRLLCGG